MRTLVPRHLEDWPSLRLAGWPLRQPKAAMARDWALRSRRKALPSAVTQMPQVPVAIRPRAAES